MTDGKLASYQENAFFGSPKRKLDIRATPVKGVLFTEEKKIMSWYWNLLVFHLVRKASPNYMEVSWIPRVCALKLTYQFYSIACLSTKCNIPRAAIAAGPIPPFPTFLILFISYLHFEARSKKSVDSVSPFFPPTKRVYFAFLLSQYVPLLCFISHFHLLFISSINTRCSLPSQKS